MLIAVFGLVIILTIFNDQREKKYVHEILNGDYEMVEANFVRAGQIGVDGMYFVKYSFKNEGNTYERIATSRHAKTYYLQCTRSDEDCSSIKFWAIYLKDEPSKSLINLTYEIQNLNDPWRPTSFDFFE